MISILVDTNILIDHLRGRKEATDFLLSLKEQPFISSLTIAELFAGVKGKKEKTALHQLINAFHVIPISNEIAEEGGLFKNKYHKSHKIGLADALIAGTVTLGKLQLATLNKKHFPMLNSVLVPY